MSNAKYLLFCLAALIAFIVLTGCATTKPCEPVIVNKVVTVPCVSSVPKKPELTSIKLPDNSSIAEQIKAISVDILLLQQYSNEQEAVIEGCR